MLTPPAITQTINVEQADRLRRQDSIRLAITEVRQFLSAAQDKAFAAYEMGDTDGEGFHNREVEVWVREERRLKNLLRRK